MARHVHYVIELENGDIVGGSPMQKPQDGIFPTGWFDRERLFGGQVTLEITRNSTQYIFITRTGSVRTPVFDAMMEKVRFFIEMEENPD